jgi:SAM-dependent methyltransferase
MASGWPTGGPDRARRWCCCTATPTERLVELAAPGPGERVLDVACGTGIVARRAAALVQPGGAAVRFPSTEEFLRRQVAGSPLAGPIGALDAEAQAALTRDLDRALRGYLDDGVTFPIQAWLGTARPAGWSGEEDAVALGAQLREATVGVCPALEAEADLGPGE